MAGPWEKYAAPQQAAPPWEKYGAAPTMPAPGMAEPQDAPGTLVQADDGTAYIAGHPEIRTVLPQDPGKRDIAMQALRARAKIGKPLGSGDAESVGQGASFGFLDELRSAATAGASKLLHGGSFGDKYDLAQEAQRQEREQFSGEHGYRALAGNIAGAIPSTIMAAPASLAMKAIPAGASFLTRMGVMGGNMARGATLGAGQGAIAGAGMADSGDRLAGAETGALMGGAIGGAAPAVGRLFSEGGRLAASVGSPAARMAAGLYDPAAEAAKRVAGTVARDAKAGQGGLTSAEFQAAKAAGQNPLVMDLGGQGTRDLARAAMNTGPAEATALLTGKIADRAKQQGGRVTDFIGGLYKGGTNAVDTEDALRSAARAANKPNYDAFAKQTEFGVWTPKLAELTQAPAVAQAIQGASKKAANDAVAQGFKKVSNPFKVNPDGSVSLAQAANGTTAVPTGRFWDAVKRGMDDQISAARRQGNLDEARQAGLLRDQLLAELDAASPAYANARGTAAKFFGASDALEAGRNFATSSQENPEALKVLMKMSAPERELFGRGFAHQIIQKVGEAGENRNVLIDKVFASPAGKQRLNMALGSERATKLEAFLRVESVLDKARSAFGNSTTAKQLAQAGLAGGALGGYSTGWDPKSIAIGALTGGALRLGAQKIDTRVAGKVAELLASDDPKAVQMAAALIAKSPSMMSNLRFATQPVATAGRTIMAPSPGAAFGQVPATAQDQPPQ